MSLKIKCDFCHEELNEPGAILLNPPHNPPQPVVEKIHLCVSCWKKVWEFLGTMFKT